jgi:CDP-diacylglycerol pyrophosphatase
MNLAAQAILFGLEGARLLRMSFPAAVALLLVLSAAASAADPAPARDRDILWKIVSSCLGPVDADYCRRCIAPRAGGTCPEAQSCEATTEVWAQNDEFVAIRDIKMCSCPADFVHGLALPRARIRGIDASPLPDGIWAFAWAAAQEKIADASTIALVVNSARGRTQDQLHVHLVRLRDDARRNFSARATSVAGLDEVWRAASRLAANPPALEDYNVLVASDLKGGFAVLVDGNDKTSMERAYTLRICR